MKATMEFKGDELKELVTQGLLAKGVRPLRVRLDTEVQYQGYGPGEHKVHTPKVVVDVDVGLPPASQPKSGGED